MAYLKLLSQKYHVETEENATELYQNSWISCGNWNLGSLRSVNCYIWCNQILVLIEILRVTQPH